MTAPSKLRQLAAFARSAEPRAVLPRRSIINDALFAAVLAAVSVAAVIFTYHHGIPAALATTVPLAARRRFPLARSWSY